MMGFAYGIQNTPSGILKIWDQKDIYGEIAKEIRKTDMKLLATFHMARTFGYVFDKDHTKEEKKKWDIYDEKNGWMYRNPDKESKEDFGVEWSNKVREVINNYKPDALWFDGLSGSIKNNVVPQDTIVNIFEDYYKQKMLWFVINYLELEFGIFHLVLDYAVMKTVETWKRSLKVIGWQIALLAIHGLT